MYSTVTLCEANLLINNCANRVQIKSYVESISWQLSVRRAEWTKSKGCGCDYFLENQW